MITDQDVIRFFIMLIANPLKLGGLILAVFALILGIVNANDNTLRLSDKKMYRSNLLLLIVIFIMGCIFFSLKITQ